MELENLKAGWGVLNERIQQNEILNKRIISDMIRNRTQSAQSRLFGYEVFCVLVMVVLCVGLPFVYHNTIMTFASFMLLEVLMVVTLIGQLYGFSFMARFDIEKKNIVELLRLVLQYKLYTRRTHIYGPALGVAALIGFFFLQGDKLFTDSWRWVVLGISSVIAVFFGYIQIRFYNRNITTIETGLKELKEFEEECE